MTDILTKTKELKELEKKATSGPWDCSGLELETNRVSYDIKMFMNDPVFVCEMRNSLPEILECLEEALKIVLIHKSTEDEIKSLKDDFKEKWGMK